MSWKAVKDISSERVRLTRRLEAENDDMGPKNTFFWNVNAE
jgi:hypothetical protein